MGELDIAGVILTPLSIIPTALGEVLHALKDDEPAFNGFGEAYFSCIRGSAVKGWKRHRKMTLNLVVPVGAIKFVFFDDRSNSPTFNALAQVTLSRANYQRLTVPPKIWMAWQGLETENMLLNIANIKHDPQEAETLALDNADIPYTAW